MLLNSCHSDYYGYGVSPVDATLGIISGRPYGGVGFLWKKGLDANVSIIECEFDWLCGIKICDDKKEYVLINWPLSRHTGMNVLTIEMVI